MPVDSHANRAKCGREFLADVPPPGTASEQELGMASVWSEPIGMREESTGAGLGAVIGDGENRVRTRDQIAGVGFFGRQKRRTYIKPVPTGRQ